MAEKLKKPRKYIQKTCQYIPITLNDIVMSDSVSPARVCE